MEYRLTVRYGAPKMKYHIATVTGRDLREVLRRVADELPDEVASTGSLVEIRPEVDPEERPWLGDEGPEPAQER